MPELAYLFHIWLKKCSFPDKEAYIFDMMLLTLARKLDVVHKTTVTINSDIPKVLLAITLAGGTILIECSRDLRIPSIELLPLYSAASGGGGSR